MILKEIYVENFKSLKKCRIRLRKFNVVVGPNASGKSNFVEIFKLLKKIYVEKVDNPFTEWWGYINVVSDHKEELPITIGLKFEKDKYEIYYRVKFDGTGGWFKILEEVFESEKLSIEKRGSRIKIAIKLEKRSVEFGIDERILSLEFYEKLKSLSRDPSIRTQRFLSKIFETESLSDILGMFDFIKNTIILKDMNIAEMRPPINPTKGAILAEDGNNVVNVLYNLFLENNMIPEGIKTLLSYIFPNTNLKFKLTDDGRILMEILENEINLLPPSISAGFFKFLTFITALELKPSLIVIDELENSLYPKAIDLIMDEFRNSKSQIIITTHSPVVVDLIYPNIGDLILIKKEKGESFFSNIENERKIRKELDEAGITLSEKWLYGRIDTKNEC